MQQEVLKFWFKEIKPSQWWATDDQFDKLITEKFSDLHAKACSCELYSWRATPEGRLAEIIVLDQFSRNIFRGKARSFSADPLALVLAQEAVSAGADKKLPVTERKFMYMPMMHSESLVIHDLALSLFKVEGMEDNLRFERHHKTIIDRFGRYPHRNEILGRISSEAEIEFLKQPGSSF